ncbi:hypothetical protein J7I44_00040 [Frateuria sp. MAH-13]|uniref:Uncharacterized protein n=1 Tax=Frateuria flava TaxID=2821489 RepID=A0ABS4DHX8_9GAMM|nr:hypothetical protein [Frateuria flava]MBP1472673.1 hypothetical protein [Frateuria flava]
MHQVAAEHDEFGSESLARPLAAAEAQVDRLVDQLLHQTDDAPAARVA